MRRCPSGLVLAMTQFLDAPVLLAHAFYRAVVMAWAADVPVAESHARVPRPIVAVCTMRMPGIVVAVAEPNLAARGRTITVVPAGVGVEPGVMTMHHHRVRVVMTTEIEVIQRPVGIGERIDVNPCRGRMVGAVVINARAPVTGLGVGRAAGQDETGEQCDNEAGVESFHDNCHAIR